MIRKGSSRRSDNGWNRIQPASMLAAEGVHPPRRIPTSARALSVANTHFRGVRRVKDTSGLKPSLCRGSIPLRSTICRLMKILNDSTSSPLRYVLDNGETYGQFYNSRDGKYHLAHYIPWRVPPRKYVCGDSGNFSPSGCEDNQGQRCAECFSKITGAFPCANT